MLLKRCFPFLLKVSGKNISSEIPIEGTNTLIGLHNYFYDSFDNISNYHKKHASLLT